MSFFRSKPKPTPVEPFFPWIPADYSVGVTRLDQEHKRLADLVNEIHTALVLNRGRIQAAKLMEQLIQETRFHFSQEETALKAADYPALEPHMAEHRLLLQEADELLRQFQAGSISGMAFPTFLKNWLIGHIRDSDRKYSATLRRQGDR